MVSFLAHTLSAMYAWSDLLGVFHYSSALTGLGAASFTLAICSRLLHTPSHTRKARSMEIRSGTARLQTYKQQLKGKVVSKIETNVEPPKDEVVQEMSEKVQGTKPKDDTGTQEKVATKVGPAVEETSAGESETQEKTPE